MADDAMSNSRSNIRCLGYGLSFAIFAFTRLVVKQAQTMRFKMEIL